MTRQISMALHTIGIVLQAVNLLTPIVPAEYRATVTLVISGAQAALAWLAHSFNPDGTPASVAFIPKG